MWRYIVRRLLWVLLVLLVITALTFLIFFVMPPTDPATTFGGKQPTPELIAEIKRQFGLDKPVYAQYGLWLKHLVLGDEYGWPGLGFSYATRSSIRDQLLDRLPVTISLALGAALVWLCIGIPIGIISAVKRRTLVDRLSMGAALFFVSAPVFWLGLMALWIFWSKLHWSPGTGYVPMTESFSSWFAHMILPWIVLAMLYAAFYARMARGNLLDTLGQDYIRTARVKGLSESKVILKHGLRASLTPLVTMFGLDLGGLLGGAVITEQIFNIQGLGRLSIDAVLGNDLPVIMAVVLVAAFFVVFANIVVDLLYAVIDPRVRLS